jgi:hypothetical protein
MSQKNISKKSNKSKLISGLLLISLASFALAFWFIYPKYFRHDEKWRFETTDNHIVKTYSLITRSLGSPDNYKFEKFCTRPSVEVGEGDLSCHTGVELAYSTNDLSQANSYVTRMTSLMITSEHLKYRSGSKTLDSTVAGASIITGASQNYIDNETQVSCIINYSYDSPLITNLRLTDSNSKLFSISLDCFGKAQKNYFPIKT